MLNRELLDYFRKVVERSKDVDERQLAKRAVRSLEYALETDDLVGERYSRDGVQGKKQASLTTNVDVDMKEAVKEFAAEHGVTVNRVLKRAIVEHLEARRWTV
jgi:hypothetical protein